MSKSWSKSCFALILLILGVSSYGQTGNVVNVTSVRNDILGGLRRGKILHIPTNLTAQEGLGKFAQ